LKVCEVINEIGRKKEFIFSFGKRKTAPWRKHRVTRPLLVVSLGVLRGDLKPVLSYIMISLTHIWR